MLETVKNVGFSEKDLVQKALPLVGFSGETKQSFGEIMIPTFAGGMNKQVQYMVIDGPSTYNVILGRPWIHEMKALPSMYDQSLKFPTPWWVQEREYIVPPKEELDEVVLDPQFPARTILVEADCADNIREKIIEFLRTNMDCFAWSHSNMIGIDPSVITHRLNIDPGFPPVQQKRRKFAPERNEVINQEVDNLRAAGKIREVNYPEWLSNVVVVPKKNNK
ncbi:uncharacterized protein LOC141640045 [Silene latifolia]|uniref:uncharacterized protein LOC141640045 n=1 Tax=Silene latifolia TaxID=37657 RepID=UPI003D78A8BA